MQDQQKPKQEPSTELDSQLTNMEIDIDSYVYREGTNVAVQAPLFMQLRSFLKAVRDAGTTMSFSADTKDPSKFFSQVPRVDLTPEAFNAVRFLTIMDELHYTNIEKGIAYNPSIGKGLDTIEQPNLK